jgi:hypothetical protein
MKKIPKSTWLKIRKKHFFPPLPFPKIEKGQEKAALEIKNKQISIDEDFLSQISEKMPESDAIEALLDHATAHYTFCPWDFANYLKLYAEAKRVCKDKDMAKKGTDYFMDVVVDTYCVREKQSTIPSLYKHMEKGKIDQVICALYQKIWGKDLNVSGYDELVKKLMRLPYMNKKRWTEVIKRFTHILRPLLEEEMLKSASNPLGDHKSMFSKESIDKGLMELAQSATSPKAFSELVDDFKEELEETGYLSQGIGRGKGQEAMANILYYIKLAQNYTLPLKKLPERKSGSIYPHSHSPWEMERPYYDVDIWTSFGKFLPGLTQVWNRKEGEILYLEEKVPNCLIIIDSSGSMIDPRKNLSYAVLGAACACEAYLKYGSEIAVYNFSDAEVGGRYLLPFTKDRMAIYQSLCKYFGGGTYLKSNDIKVFEGNDMDIFLITDMKISNFSEVVNYFNNIKNRVTAVHIGESTHSKRFALSVSKKTNISLYHVEKKEDIPKIVLGKVKEYLHQMF